jgi:hypothetical protein
MKVAAETSHVTVQTEVGKLPSAPASANEVSHATVQTDAQNVAVATEVVHATIQTETAVPEVGHVAIQTVTIVPEVDHVTVSTEAATAPEVCHVTVQTETYGAEVGHLTVETEAAAAPEVGEVAVQTEAAGGDASGSSQPEVGYVPERIFLDYVAETDQKLTSIIKKLGKFYYYMLQVPLARCGNHKAALGKAMFRIVFVT